MIRRHLDITIQVVELYESGMFLVRSRTSSINDLYVDVQRNRNLHYHQRQDNNNKKMRKMISPLQQHVRWDFETLPVEGRRRLPIKQQQQQQQQTKTMMLLHILLCCTRMYCYRTVIGDLAKPFIPIGILSLPYHSHPRLTL
jgi:hypothetical protein